MRTTDLSGSLSRELDLAAEIIESSEQASDRLGAIAASEVIGAKIFIFHPILEHVPSGIEHRGGDCQNGFFGAAASFEAQELGLQVATLDADGGPGGRDQGGFEPRCPFAGASRAAFAGALVISGTHRRPGQHPAMGKRAMSTPISATKTCAVSSLTPGIVVSRRGAPPIGAKGFLPSPSPPPGGGW